MASIKIRDIQKLSKTEREKKLKDLKMELVKSRASASKTGSSKTKEIKKIIARIFTLNSQEAEEKSSVVPKSTQLLGRRG